MLLDFDNVSVNNDEVVIKMMSTEMEIRGDIGAGVSERIREMEWIGVMELMMNRC